MVSTMSRFWAHRPSPALIIATLSLIVALGGTSYAVSQLPKNSVGKRQLRTNAVTVKKIKRNAINTRKVKNGSLLAKDFKAGQLPAGQKGDKGDPGVADGLGGVAPESYVKGGGSLLRARLGLNDGQTDVSLLSIPGVGSFTVNCTNAADTISTRFFNQSGGRVVRIHDARTESSMGVFGGSLNDGENTGRTTTDTGSNKSHLHTYEIAPADGPGPIAHVRIAAVSSATGDARCVFSASAIAG
jgi:hypothetical protein